MATEYLMLENLVANSFNDLMTDADTGESQLRFVTRPSRVTIAIEADAVGIVMEIQSGGRTVVPRSTLDAGGTVGVFPNIREKAFTFPAAAGEKLRIALTEEAGTATTDVMAMVDVTPLA